MALRANVLYCSGLGIFSATNGQALSHPKGLSGPSAKAGGPKGNLLAEHGANGLGAVSGG